MARNYSSISEPKTLSADITNVATQMTLNNVTGLPSPPYVLVISPDTSSEEVVLVTTDQTGVTAPTVKISRAIETGASAVPHTNGVEVRHMIVGTDLQIVHDHFSNDSVSAGTAHGATGGVVGRTNTQTLTNKTLTSPVITSPAITGGTVNGGAALTVDSTELNYVDGVTSAIQTQLNTIVNTTIPNATPVGTIVMYGGTSAPTGWLLCNGQSTASYTALAAVVGANVPDLMGRAPIGYGDSADSGITTRSTIGAKVGTETHTLTAAEIPGHTHGVTIMGSDLSYGTAALQGSNGGTQQSINAAEGGGSNPAGGGSHPNMQPSTVVNFIIKH